MLLFLSNSISNFLCDNFCWILTFDGASRLLWLSVLWAIMEFVTRVVARYNGNAKIVDHIVKTKDEGSWGLIAFSSALMLAITLFILHYQWKPDLPSYFVPIGMVLMGIGIALRIWAVITLGKFFTMRVMIFSDHHLIRGGPYHWLRHPSYSGVFITALGFGLATGYFMVLFPFLIILGLVLGYRIYVEEKALDEQFGHEWKNYTAKTWRILPWVY